MKRVMMGAAALALCGCVAVKMSAVKVEPAKPIVYDKQPEVEIRVATNGDDANDGSKSKPVKTLKRAIELSRAVESDAAKTIVFADGFYYVDAIITLNAADYDLTIKAEHSGKATISGALPVSGWKQDPADKRFLVADFPFDAKEGMLYALTVNGELADFSAYPQYGGEKKLRYIATEEDVGKNNRTVFKYDRTDIPDGFTFKDLDISSAFLFIPQEWASTRTYVATNDWQNDTFYLKQRTDMPLGRFNTGYQIMNTRLGLRHPGSWMFEAAAKRIIYWPKAGEMPVGIKATVSSTVGILYLNGTANLKVSGFLFEGCAAPFTSSCWQLPIPAFIGGHHPRKCVIEDCEMRNTAGHGIQLVKPVNCAVRRCHIHHVGSCCIDYIDGGDASEILDCHVHHNGLFALAASAIGMQISNSKCIGNHIHHTPGCGVVMWSGFSLFASNHLHHTMTLIRDGGGVYGAMNYCVFKDNYVHDSGDWPGLYNDEGGQHTVYTGNRFENCWWPIHMHDCRNITVAENVFVNDGSFRFSFQGSTHCTFKDNLIKTTMPITEDGYVEACDIWADNEVQLKQADGTYRSIGKVTLPREALPPKGPVSAVRVKTPAFKDCKHVSEYFRTPGIGRARCDRDRRGLLVPGVPGSYAVCGFDDDYLYLAGTYEYNKLGPYACAQNLGTAWGSHDGLRFHFKCFNVSIFFMSKTNLTAVSSDPALIFTLEDSFSATGWWGRSHYGLRLPLKRLGLDGKTAEGKEIPFNVTFFNGDHNEYKYFNQPSGGDILTGKLKFKPCVIDYAGLVTTYKTVESTGKASPGPVWPHGAAQPCPVTCNRPGDDETGSRKGYEFRHSRLVGIADRGAFMMLAFSGDDPQGLPRFDQGIEKSSEIAKPGFYAVNVERWALRNELTASKNVAYHRYVYDRGGKLKVMLTVAADGEAKVSRDGVIEGRDRGLFAKIAFEQKPVAIRELKADAKLGKRYVLDFHIPAGSKGFVCAKVAVSEQSLDDARRLFASDPEGFDFNARKQECHDAWDKLLKDVKADGDNQKYAIHYFDVVNGNAK